MMYTNYCVKCHHHLKSTNGILHYNRNFATLTEPLMPFAVARISNLLWNLLSSNLQEVYNMVQLNYSLWSNCRLCLHKLEDHRWDPVSKRVRCYRCLCRKKRAFQIWSVVEQEILDGWINLQYKVQDLSLVWSPKQWALPLNSSEWYLMVVQVLQLWL